MSSLPITMRAIDPAGPGGPEVLVVVERPVPTPRAGELLVRVQAAGINRPDILQRLGLYPMPAGAPSIPGLEISGEVVAAGTDSRFQRGDRVCALLAGGGYAEYAVVPEGQCLPIPAGLSAIAAASLPETYFTVWANLFDDAGAVAGETVLIHGGTSGIGTTAIQLARAFGLTPIVTAGSAAKCAAALAVGAAHAFDYRAEDWSARAREVTGGRGVDIVLDMVGGDYLPRNIAALAPGGRHVSIATQRGATGELNLAMVMRGRLRLSGSMLRPRSVAEKAAIAERLRARVWPLFADGTLRSLVDATFPLAEAAAAHRRMEAGSHVGKIVLTL